MKPPCPAFLIALSLCAQTPPQPGRSLDVREAPKRKEELERARKSRARFEALRQAKAEELTRAYAREQQRQAALKAAKAPTTGVLVLGGPPAAAPAAPAPSAPRPIATPRTPEALLAVLRAQALPRDRNHCRWEVVSFDGRILILERTGANYRKRFRIPLAAVQCKPEQEWVNHAWRDAPVLLFEARDHRIPYTTTYTTGRPDEGVDTIVGLPVADAAAAARTVKEYLAQAAAQP